METGKRIRMRRRWKQGGAGNVKWMRMGMGWGHGQGQGPLPAPGQESGLAEGQGRGLAAHCPRGPQVLCLRVGVAGVPPLLRLRTRSGHPAGGAGGGAHPAHGGGRRAVRTGGVLPHLGQAGLPGEGAPHGERVLGPDLSPQPPCPPRPPARPSVWGTEWRRLRRSSWHSRVGSARSTAWPCSPRAPICSPVPSAHSPPRPLPTQVPGPPDNTGPPPQAAPAVWEPQPLGPHPSSSPSSCDPLQLPKPPVHKTPPSHPPCCPPTGLAHVHKRKVFPCTVISVENLQSEASR